MILQTRNKLMKKTIRNHSFTFFSKSKSLLNKTNSIKPNKIFNCKNRKKEKKFKKPIPRLYFQLKLICYNLPEKSIKKIKILVDSILLINNLIEILIKNHLKLIKSLCSNLF